MPLCQETAAFDASGLDFLFPSSVTITRTSESDFKSRQIHVWIDEERVATLLWGDSVTRELEPGRHRLRVSNTLVWKSLEFTLEPGGQLFFEVVNRASFSTYFLLAVIGFGPLYLTVQRM